MPNLPGDYFERRVELVRLGYREVLYPLTKGMLTFGELVKNRQKFKTYINQEGKLVKWTPKAFHKSECKKITAKWIPVDKPVLCFAIEGSSEIYQCSVPHFVANFATVIKVGNRSILYDISEDRIPDTRVKI